jgi:TonB family protein
MDAKSLRERKCSHCCTMTSRKNLFWILPLCIGLISASAEQAPSAQQLLDDAHKATDLSSIGAYILHATIIINSGDPKIERQAKLTILRDHDRARFTLETDGRTEERVILGSKEFVVPGQGTLVAMGVSNLDHRWDLSTPQKFASHEIFSFGSVRKQKIQGHDAWCFDRKAESKIKLCFDATTSVLLHEGANGKNRWEYSDYTSLGTRLYPQKVQIFRENLAPFEIRQISISPAQFNYDVFKVPEKSIEMERCDSEEAPKPLHTPEPEFSDAARSARAEGVVYLYVLINARGNVAESQALAMDAYGLAQNAVNTVKTWRFKPATCNGHAVAAEMNIEVDFRYR